MRASINIHTKKKNITSGSCNLRRLAYTYNIQHAEKFTT